MGSNFTNITELLVIIRCILAPPGKLNDELKYHCIVFIIFII